MGRPYKDLSTSPRLGCPVGGRCVPLQGVIVVICGDLRNPRQHHRWLCAPIWRFDVRGRQPGSVIANLEAVTNRATHAVRYQDTLVRAETRDTTVTALLDNPRIGVLHLDRRGQIIAVNDRARSILRHGDGLSDRDGVLRARKAADRLRLERLVASALPASGAVAVSGSMLLGRSYGSPPFVVHVKPVAVPQPDYGARHIAALILIIEPRSQHRVDPDLVGQDPFLSSLRSEKETSGAQSQTVSIEWSEYGRLPGVGLNRNERIAALERKKAQIANRIVRLRNQESAKQRKLDTRRKILAGAWVLHRAGQDPAAQQHLIQGLDGFLVHPRDRELFGLAPNKENSDGNPS